MTSIQRDALESVRLLATIALQLDDAKQSETATAEAVRLDLWTALVRAVAALELAEE